MERFLFRGHQTANAVHRCCLPRRPPHSVVDEPIQERICFQEISTSTRRDHPRPHHVRRTRSIRTVDAKQMRGERKSFRNFALFIEYQSDLFPRRARNALIRERNVPFLSTLHSSGAAKQFFRLNAFFPPSPWSFNTILT